MVASSAATRALDQINSQPQEKVNSELGALLYGSLVTQLLKDIEDVDAVNLELEKLGRDIGVRLVEEFLAKSQLANCNDFPDTCEIVAKAAIKMFLGVNAQIIAVEDSGTVCHMSLPHNPLIEFVELPSALENLSLNNLIAGAIQGALRQLQMRVKVTILKDTLKGHETNLFRLEMEELLKEAFVDPEEL